MYTAHTNEELTTIYHKLARELSFFYAAEGQSWYAEASARSACQGLFRELCQEFKKRNLPLPEGDYLV